uniref:Uncharacterized protein n=1 Tax=Arundo donax TaxID=35708 RepID=A0A0A9EUJ6_ARUDO
MWRSSPLACPFVAAFLVPLGAAATAGFGAG